MKNSTQPSLFSSLILSCSSTELYSQVSSIPWWKSLLFLVFYNFLGALALIALLYSHLFTSGTLQQDILGIYDRIIPEIEGAYSDGNLETEPHELTAVIGIDEASDFYIQKNPLKDSVLEYAFKLDTLKNISEHTESYIGISVYRNGVVINSGLGNQELAFSEIGIENDFLITIGSLRDHLSELLPEILESIRIFTITAGPLLLTLYFVFSGFFQALLFAFFGSFSLLIRKADFAYFDLLKLSFYAGVPSLLFLVVTHILGISISWMPVMIHICFYFIGLQHYSLKKS
ncbi:MAG: DUF1189 family protein [Candidatus Gracilibacteria bacterium]|nr:DUF1189 family protein [Candidatus Gracilibacteria bacterium]